MRKELLQEVADMIHELESREVSVAERTIQVTLREKAASDKEVELTKRAAEIEEMERKAQNVLDATSGIRKELALRKARIKTLEDEAEVREARLAESRAEKGRLKERLNQIENQLVSAVR